MPDPTKPDPTKPDPPSSNSTSSSAIRLRVAAAIDLDYILDLEAAGRREGFIRGDDRPAHVARMGEAHVVYYVIEQGAARVGFVILGGVGGDDKAIEIGRLMIAPEARGVGQAALAEILRCVFEDHDAHRVWLDTIADNARARHVYAKLGFVEEGRLRQALRFGGRYHDLILFGLLREEWDNLRASATD